MSEVILEEETANPYNARKSWHKPDKPKMGDADGLFYAPEQQATLEEEAPEVEEAQPQKRANYKKRYDDLKRHYDQRVSEFKQREEELEAMARSSQPSYEPPKTEEELEAFKQEYPDLYSTVESVAHMQSQRQVADLEAQLQSIRQRESEVMRREAETTLKDRHPDYEDLRGSDNFHAWAKEQPEQIQSWIYDNPDNVTLAAKAIDLYKMENGITQTKSQPKPRQQKGSAADMVSTKTTSVDAQQPKIWTEGEIAAMSLDQFDRVEDEIKQAMMEGRVVK
jgi:DNA repair exonuclease SbcCD ATPase subunit